MTSDSSTVRDLSMNNISEIQPRAFHRLHLLSELRISGNQLRYISGHALQGLHNLKVLRLDANLLSEVPAGTFRGVRSLRHLWLDDNSLTKIPVTALDSLPSLQAMTLALNQITHIPDYAFTNLSALVVLDLNYNDLQEFPVAIRTLSKLQELHFYENPIQFVGKSAFQFLPKLHTLSLNGATQIREFPDLKGTTSLEILELSYNQIEDLPSFYHCSALQEIGLQHNQIRRIESSTFQQLTSLRALDLSWNMIEWIHPDAFASLLSLTKLDLTENRLSSVPVAGLGGLTHLKLRGNTDLYDAFSPDLFPRMRVMEMPYAYQCCVYGSCDSYKPAGQWDTEQSNTDEDLHKRTVAMYPIHTDTHYDPDLEEFQLEIEESKLQTSVQCTPTPGPFRPCDSLLGSWLVRLGLWSISLVSLLGNSILLLSLFGSPGYMSPLRFTVACMGVGEYGSSPFCLPSPLPPPSSRQPSSLGFPLALIMMNTLCLLIVTGSYIRLYWELLRGECEGLWDCAMIKHVAWLIFTNGLLYVPVAFLSLCSLLGLLSLGEEVLKSTLLLLQPLPACLNPLLFLLFTRDHSPIFLWSRPKARPQLRRDHTLDSLVSVETEKSSCSDSSTHTSLADADALCSGGSSLQPRLDPIRFSHCSSTSSVPLIPCQIPTPAARDRDRATERRSLDKDECLRSLDQDVIHNTCSLYHSTMAPSLSSHL
ncbi:hypothetical protein F2P81_011550 [Scophthalmus maximus]|uniref:G-protein coupled receptors family 1 profile domain-containing protein n=1 Tax=Scophthalmus maximus TaxID=52904 RepID=A0A6A4SVW8_SCOMX|nr:hypothetical protein F2P81_011550 [Scophthalmus maximus]